MLREPKSLATSSEVEAVASELARSQRPPVLVSLHRPATRVSLQAAKSFAIGMGHTVLTATVAAALFFGDVRHVASQTYNTGTGASKDGVSKLPVPVLVAFFFSS